MLKLYNISKNYPLKQGSRPILRGINFEIDTGETIGILGRNGSGKSTLVRIISGAEAPDSGGIYRGMNVSWPLAFSGGFQGSLTGYDNIRFICRIYNTQIGDKLKFIQQFSELGDYLFEPVKTYSSGMRARLAFALSMAIEFDCFLIDEIVAVGDSNFQKKCHFELFENRKNRAKVIVSHNPDFINQHCSKAYVLHNGLIFKFETLEQSVNFYNQQN
jgi:capsular polysaccharide transport system ATP-binding protein